MSGVLESPADGVFATAADTPPRPMRKDAARNRQLLLTAARDVFRERGLEASLDDVAARAGVGVGTAYRHFANKHELARAVLGERIEEILALTASCADDADPWRGMVTFIESAAEVQAADRGLREVLMGAHDPQQMAEIHDRMTGPLTTLVARARDAGAVRADAEATDLGVVVMMLCTVADVTADSAPGLWRRYLPMLLDGLRPGAALPVPAIDVDTLRVAMSTYKQRMDGGACR